jgi:hypothetical protein
MNFEVTPEFETALKRLAKKYHSLKEDYLTFLAELEKIQQWAMKYFPTAGKHELLLKAKEKENAVGEELFFTSRFFRTKSFSYIFTINQKWRMCKRLLLFRYCNLCTKNNLVEQDLSKKNKVVRI